MKKLIILSGLPGSGKSTVAEGLAKKLALPVLSVDPIESSIIKSGFKRSFETGLAAYLVAEALAAEHLKLGISAIVDAVNAEKEGRALWLNLSKRHKAKLIIIECVLDKAIHRKRIESRVRGMRGIPEVTWLDVEKRRKKYLEWNRERLILDTANPVAQTLGRALKYVGGT